METLFVFVVLMFSIGLVLGSVDVQGTGTGDDEPVGSVGDTVIVPGGSCPGCGAPRGVRPGCSFCGKGR